MAVSEQETASDPNVSGGDAGVVATTSKAAATDVPAETANVDADGDAADDADADASMTSPETAAQGAAESSTSATDSGSTSPSSANTSTPYLPLPPLPLEVFLRTMHFLPIRQVTRLRAVSSTWRKVIDGDYRLWSHFSCSLEDTRLASQLELYTRNATPKQVGQHGGIRHLTIKLGSAPLRELAEADLITFEEAEESFEGIVETLSTASCWACRTANGVQLRSTLRSFELELRPNTYVTARMIHCFDEMRSANLFCELNS